MTPRRGWPSRVVERCVCLKSCVLCTLLFFEVGATSACPGSLVCFRQTMCSQGLWCANIVGGLCRGRGQITSCTLVNPPSCQSTLGCSFLGEHIDTSFSFDWDGGPLR